jgi:hypothetical protein
VRGAAALHVIDRLPARALILDVAFQGLPYRQPLDLAPPFGVATMARALASAWSNDRAAVRSLRIVGKAQGHEAIPCDWLPGLRSTAANVTPQHPSPGLALPTLPAQMHLAIDQGLPMWLPTALEPNSGARTIQSCVFDSAVIEKRSFDVERNVSALSVEDKCYS